MRSSIALKKKENIAFQKELFKKNENFYIFFHNFVFLKSFVLRNLVHLNFCWMKIAIFYYNFLGLKTFLSLKRRSDEKFVLTITKILF